MYWEQTGPQIPCFILKAYFLIILHVYWKVSKFECHSRRGHLKKMGVHAYVFVLQLFLISNNNLRRKIKWSEKIKSRTILYGINIFIQECHLRTYRPKSRIAHSAATLVDIKYLFVIGGGGDSFHRAGHKNKQGYITAENICIRKRKHNLQRLECACFI